MAEISNSFVIEAPVKLHLRPAGDIVTFFQKLIAGNPTVEACLRLDSLDPRFDSEEDGEECDDPTSMTKVMMFTAIASTGWDTENRFRVVLRGPKDIIEPLIQSAQTELQALANTWTKYTIENRTMND